MNMHLGLHVKAVIGTTKHATFWVTSSFNIGWNYKHKLSNFF